MEAAPINDDSKFMSEVNNSTNFDNTENCINFPLQNDVTIPDIPPLEQSQSDFQKPNNHQAAVLICNILNANSNSCSHNSLHLKFKISKCKTCFCACCIIVGFISIIVACLFCAEKKCGNSHDSISPPLIYWNSHWLCNYGYEQDFVERRMSCNRNYRELEILGMKYPHDYKIVCDSCGYVLKKGHDSGSFSAGLIFGMLGVIFLGFTLYFLNFM